MPISKSYLFVLKEIFIYFSEKLSDRGERLGHADTRTSICVSLVALMCLGHLLLPSQTR